MSQSLTFYNHMEGEMDLETAFRRIKEFINADPCSVYRLSVGTDSHIHHKITRFITAIHLHRLGSGAWGCLRKYNLNRPIQSVREKISMETAFSQEIADLFMSRYVMELNDLLIPFIDRGADFSFEIHLDIGRDGATKDLIQEMTGRIAAMGLEAKIKPDSYTAFSYANRYTK